MSTMEIFIIDDEKNTTGILQEFFKSMGLDVVVYHQALKFFEDNPDLHNALLLLDLQMPEMDGIEVLRQLTQRKLSPNIILMSGYDPSVLHSAEQLAKEHGLNVIATLKKPIKFATFQSTIQQFQDIIPTAYSINQSEEKILTPDDVEDAILEKQFILHYQPQISLKQNKIVGVEALIRWEHPKHGLIFPNAFIKLAEKNGLLGDITAYVLKQSLEQMCIWRKSGFNLQMSINISADNIKSLVLPEQLARLLQKNQIDPNLLTLEVTESALMEELVTSLDILTRLRMKGIQLSIDDFGTGHSSLTQLYRVPFTELKIDRSFVMKMAHDKEAQGIVKMCIKLAHELKMLVVAEGVEDKATLELLQYLECDIVQGYYFAKPMPAEEILNWSIK